ncbi:hypothetical protein AGABI1DRAFT_38606 [Agaricus bisporus var. burnettii JB137-S8]|uniref:uS12 prolyl 3,4-dihydroxylase n=1 Tax=Agaricus bisporus var. burnettii (strain JB137-S8 / ATCC MYA-4627 / FGSC 10392) TaxID=597362 RepID=K5XXD7_AGABU|nr:uncharacterized protein AGABI1DRAFT_38606 [Agaricus bisporus var. burnettii JB137-S8]EKM79955.1 hypothetical protein AGABI1DRAFT_38606 [Agaricus bisporus var. burnettii JB137-S8]
MPSSSSSFAANLFDHNTIAAHNNSYHNNSPFKHSVIDKLFQDDLLSKVKDECLSINFTEKQTDIYKVHQTGDLASLNYIKPEERDQLANLLTLRDALYSAQFRNFLRVVTGCGPLSGIKQDMSVNSYRKGCHLLNHDDVISSRRVSYILYMPITPRHIWRKEWGGALELYPVIKGEDGTPVPDVTPSKIIPPSWNQFVFFEVQPGKSFHSVEEVIVGGEGDNRNRLSISGWFHAAQPGEEGYVPEQNSTYKSSREQLQTTSIEFRPYTPTDEEALAFATTLSDDHIAFLSEFLNPVYLQPRTMQALSARFVEESSLELHQFLNNPLSQALQPRLRELDVKDGLGPDRPLTIPNHTAGVAWQPPTGVDRASYFNTRPHSNDRTRSPSFSPNPNWIIRGPPHKWRYCTLSPKSLHKLEAVTPRSAHASPVEIMRSLQDELFPSDAFRAWLAIVAGLVPMGWICEARRFRPGLDYTLATSEANEARLDVVLGLTPELCDIKGSRGNSKDVQTNDWQSSDWGGWECYMAPHNEDDDPTVYKSGNSSQLRNENIRQRPSKSNTEDADQMEIEEEADTYGNDDDSTLLTVHPGFNRLLLVLRDEKVMRFVKYVSASAEGSRWDVCAEYEVGALQPDDDDDDAQEG